MGIPPNHPAIRQAEARGLILETRHPRSGRATGTVPRVTLTLPPSANNLFCDGTRLGKGHRRVKTVEYRAWIDLSVGTARTLAPPPIPCRFFYLVTGEYNPDRDGDNLCKPLLDLFVSAEVIPDDRLRVVRGCCWDSEPTRDEAGVICWFEEWTP